VVGEEVAAEEVSGGEEVAGFTSEWATATLLLADEVEGDAASVGVHAAVVR